MRLLPKTCGVTIELFEIVRMVLDPKTKINNLVCLLESIEAIILILTRSLKSLIMQSSLCIKKNNLLVDVLDKFQVLFQQLLIEIIEKLASGEHLSEVVQKNVTNAIDSLGSICLHLGNWLSLSNKSIIISCVWLLKYVRAIVFIIGLNLGWWRAAHLTLSCLTDDITYQRALSINTDASLLNLLLKQCLSQTIEQLRIFLIESFINALTEDGHASPFSCELCVRSDVLFVVIKIIVDSYKHEFIQSLEFIEWIYHFFLEALPGDKLVELLCYIGSDLISHNCYDLAIKYLTHPVKDCDTSSNININRIYNELIVYFTTENWQKLIETVDCKFKNVSSSIAQSGRDSDIIFLKAHAHDQLHNYEEAIKCYVEALTITTTNNLILTNGSDLLTSLFSVSVRLNRWNIIEIILHKFPTFDINSVIDLKEQQTDPLLICATQNAPINIVNLLISRGADLEQVDQMGNTALIIACLNERIDIVELLLSKGSNPNAKDFNGITPIHIAAESNLQMLQLLYENNGNINSLSHNNWSVLHSAASGIVESVESWDIIEWLVKHGANLDIIDSHGQSVSDIFEQKDWSYRDHYERILESIATDTPTFGV